MDSLRPSPSPSRSPHTHLLRPRRSFQRNPFSSKTNLLTGGAILGASDKLQSPVKLVDIPPPSSAPALEQNAQSKALNRRGGAALFPASPGAVEPNRAAPPHAPSSPFASTSTAVLPPACLPSASAASTTTRSSTRPGQREVAGLKRLASAFGGTLLGKTRSSTARKAFDLGDWNHDLAAIASHPPSSTPTSPDPQDDPLAAAAAIDNAPPASSRTGPSGASSSADMSSPVTELSPRATRPRPSYGRAGEDFAARLEPTPSDSRRRKSDEMEEDERDSFGPSNAAVAPVQRREPLHMHPRAGHTRTHSLAFAHSLPSSRMLSQHASDGLATTLASPSSIPRSVSTLNFETPCYPGSSPARSPLAGTMPPPSKRVSIERMPCFDEDEDGEASGLSGDDAVFGGPSVSLSSSTAATTSAPRKVARVRSLSRPSVPSFPSFHIVAIPASSSHPGFETPAFSPALPSPSDSLRPPSSISRSRVASSGTGLDTLNESGPAIDYFSTSGSDLRDGAISPVSVSSMESTMTPPRRRGGEPGAFSLFGTGGAAVLSAAERAARRHSMMPHANNFSHHALSQLANGEVDANGNSPAKKGTGSTSGSLSMPDMQAGAGATDGDMRVAVANGKDRPPPLPRLRPLGSASSAVRRLSLAPNSQSFDSLRPFGTPIQPAPVGRKRNANGALLAGGATSKLGAVSPIVNPPSSSPAQPRWKARSTADHDMEDDVVEEEDEMPSRLSIDSWRDGPTPTLTDTATSISSSSLCTSHSGLIDHGDMGVAVTTSTSAHSLNSTNGAAHPDSGLHHGDGGSTFFTPQNYKNVRPLAAAFLSTGLVSKRARPRTNSLGASGAPTFNLHQHLMRQVGYEQQQGAPSPTRTTAPLHAMEAVDPSASGMLPNPLVTSLSRPSVMPDTPVKRSSFVHGQTGSIVAPQARTSHAPATPGLMVQTTHDSSDEGHGSPATDALDTGSPIGPGGALSTQQTAALALASAGRSPLSMVDDHERDSLSPLASSKKPFHRSISPLSGRSVESSASSDGTAAGRRIDPACDQSPSMHASKTGGGRFTSASTSVRNSLGRVRPALFRRRSSGQLSSEGSFFGIQYRSGGSSSGKSSASATIAEGEPMTPTRSVGGRYWEGTQLLDTPTEEPVPITPAMSNFPSIPSHPLAPSGQSTVFLQSVATPAHAPRASFPMTEAESLQHHLVKPSGSGRPQFKIRHSSSTVLSLRQQEMSQPSWFESNYTLLRNLGNGAFSDAWEVADLSRQGRVYAVKRTKNPFLGPKDRLRRLEEVDILRLFSTEADASPHLISLVDAWEQSGHLFIQTELCPAGNLAWWLEEYGSDNEQLDEARVWKILAELSAGVAHLHARNVLHLDLKPANVFITDKGHLKIGDFGLATRWPRTDPLSIMKGAAVDSPPWGEPGLRGDPIWRTQEGERRTRAKSNGDAPEDLEREGDREYIAPEILSGRYGKEADVFSLGLVVLEAAANVVLPDNGPAWQKLRSNDFSDVPLSRLSPSLISVLQGMLHKSPDLRAPITDVTRHPVVAQLLSMLHASLWSDRRDEDGPPEVLGAVCAEADSFLHDVFTKAYPDQASPAATPAFPLLIQDPPAFRIDEAVEPIETDGQDERMDVDD